MRRRPKMMLVGVGGGRGGRAVMVDPRGGDEVETPAHRRLKELAMVFLRHHGCQAMATEVRCPIGRYRFDVAGYFDPAPRSRWRERPVEERTARTVLIECKQTRADFLRDDLGADALLAEREGLERIRESIERQRIMKEEPQLRGEACSLFAELDDWDFSSSRLRSYHKVLHRLQRVDEKLHGHTKFHFIARYRLADRLYLACPQGLVRRREVPRGWGLLECPQQLLQPSAAVPERPFRVGAEGPIHHADDARRVRLLRNIAVAAGQAVRRAEGVDHLPRSTTLGD